MANGKLSAVPFAQATDEFCDAQPLNRNAARFGPTDAVPDDVRGSLNTAFDALLAIHGISSMLIADDDEKAAGEGGAPLAPELSHSLLTAVRVISHLAGAQLCRVADRLEAQQTA